MLIHFNLIGIGTAMDILERRLRSNTPAIKEVQVVKFGDGGRQFQVTGEGSGFVEALAQEIAEHHNKEMKQHQAKIRMLEEQLLVYEGKVDP